MCWSASASIVATAVGGAATVYAAKKGQPKVRYLTLAFFTLMELLQAVSYIWINQCDLSANTYLTYLGYLHISFQIPVANAFMLSFISESRRKKWFKPVMAISFIATLIMLMKLFLPMILEIPQEWMCKTWQTMCSTANACTYQGNWHLAWKFPLMGFDPYYLIYFIPVFILPMLYGAWRLSLFHFAFGPMLAYFLTTDRNEVPAIWCLFSIAVVIVVLFKPLRRWFEVHDRKSI